MPHLVSPPVIEKANTLPTIGVAICTCNGMPYVEQQLQSIVSQDLLPDEIVVSDDASDDGTWEYLLSWSQLQTIPVVLQRNTPRLGIVKNFESAVTRLNTDIIFLCDQDDIWEHSKIRLLVNRLAANAALLMVHSDAQLVDRDGHDLGSALLDAVSLTVYERELIRDGKAMEVLCRRNVVTGATAAFKRSLLEIAVPFAPDWLHDEWLAILAASANAIDLEPCSTVRYRQHGRNAIGMEAPGISRVFNRFKFVAKLPGGKFQSLRLTRIEQLLDRLKVSGGLPQQWEAMLIDWYHFALFRASLPAPIAIRMFSVLKRGLLTNGYQRFGRGWLSAFRDILKR